MKSFILTLRDSTERHAHAEKQFQGMEYEFFYGINNHKLGLWPMRETGDGPGEFLSLGYVGNFLSHLMLWHVVAYGPWPEVMIYEDDVVLGHDYQRNLSQRLYATPKDWEFIFVGHCCAEDKDKSEQGTGVYILKYPMCLHAYAITREGARKLIDTQTEMFKPLDIQLCLRSFPNMKVYTFWPGLAEQNQKTLPKAV